LPAGVGSRTVGAPWSWLRDQFARGGQGSAAGGWQLDRDDAEEISERADEMVAVARQFAPERCTSAAQCYGLTRDARPSVRLMIENLRRPDLLDTVRVAPWRAG